MEVEKPLQVVDFTTEKDFNKSKKNKKRKRVGNRIPIGAEAAKKISRQRGAAAAEKVVPESESDVEESIEEEQVDEIDVLEQSSSDEETTAPNTFSGALESLLGRAEAAHADGRPELHILKDVPKLKNEEADEAARVARQAREASRIALLQRKLFKNKDHRVPDFSGADLEGKLRKVATRGVVKLFNAIKMHQKTSENVPSATTRTVTNDAVKKKFMESLKRSNARKEGSNGATEDNSDEEASVRKSAAKKAGAGSSTPSWEVLRDDYLLGAKMKDWNKESDEE